MSSRKDVADMIFPDITETIADLQKKYPERPQRVVTRIAPSPTGFMHVGTIYMSIVDERFAHQHDGIFFLRIEDTDQKRSLEGAIDLIIDGLKTCDISIDEGPLGPNNSDVGNYGPYIQSQRKNLYYTFAKDLITRGLAYPCWMTAEEMEKTREYQMKAKITTGIYGNYSVRRNKTPDEIVEQIAKDKNFVIRFRSHGDVTKKIIFDDINKDKVNMADNYNDIVLVKSNDGLPTYHLAHIVDDHLMRATHIIRGDEWLTSVPLHLQLFQAFGLTPPIYGHMPPVCKFDEDGKKRKLSKRKDYESDLQNLFKLGFSSEGVVDYLTIIIDSSYEERQKNNPEKTIKEFPLDIYKMNSSRALFDLVKLRNVNNAYLSKLSNDGLYKQSLLRANKYKPELATLLESDPEYMKKAIGIERHTEKDPKRFTTFEDVYNQLAFFLDDERTKLIDGMVLPGIFTKEVTSKFLNEYKTALNLEDPTEVWFEKLKEIGKKHRFASNNAEFKEGGYIGKIGDIAMLLRMTICGSPKTPDLYSVMKVMGKDRILKRLEKFC